ncbi:glycosyltransferase family protein [Pseudoxanthomonas daejeonensis]|nr:glycosyltransferase family 4 protein [Pseudoxanthomonas daejeonensis]
MSRIAAVDAIFGDGPRLYVHLGSHHSKADGEIIHDHGDGLHEICLNVTEHAHRDTIGSLLDHVRFLYVHTVHLAEFVAPWLDTGKIVVDFHGVVPEEETMLGRPELAPKYEVIEQQVLEGAMACVMVSQAMQEHYIAKYPQLSPRRCIILPIVEAMEAESRGRRDGELPVRVVYAGGTQAWQNLDAMLGVARSSQSVGRFRFLSHDHELIRRRAAELGIQEGIECLFSPKSRLAAEYAAADFGFALRDDSPVNRVSSPTKIFEYLQCGVIPIVRSPRLGDFQSLGYRYVTEEEFSSGLFPDSSSRAWMIDDNLGVARKLRDRFRIGAAELIALRG